MMRRRTAVWLVATATAFAVLGAASAWRTAFPQARAVSRDHDAPAGREESQLALADRGIGVVFFDRRPGSDTRAGDTGDTGARVAADSITADTLVLLRDTTGRRAIARYIMRSSARSWSFALETRETVERTSIEFDYEVEGLPVDLVTSDERWVRAIYGRAPDGSARRGWVRVTPGLVRYHPWTTLMRERALFFDAGIAPEFFGTPGGPVVQFPIGRGADGAADYIMHPMAIRDEWMRVRVATPSDMCGAPDSVRQAVLWIRYLSASGRPRVWYHARGC